MTWVASVVLAVTSWLGCGHMHFDPAATLDTSHVTDQRQWFGVQGVVFGEVIGGRELD